MNWRIHVSNHTIRHLEILRGDPSLLAAWTQPNRVECFHLLTGTSHGFCEFSALPTEDDFHDQEWRTYLEPTDDGPWRTRLTKLMLQRLTIYRTEDGRIRLVHFTGGRLLWIGEEDDRALTFAEDLVVIDLDRTSGRAATLNSGGRLDIYQCGDLLSSFDIGLRINPFEAAGLAICGDGEKVYLTDGRQIVFLDLPESLTRKINIHYGLGAIALSPDGKTLFCSDNGAGLIRAYRGNDLAQTHQRFAQDLISEAHQVQLMADLPPASIAISAMAAGENGLIAFAMSGVICVTHIERLTSLP